ncbi:hypothetical protein [Candidatus Arthromitus sp. SFB-mouse]|uniref:hypothetical protein n=1 Tax=Candidatus Arthromitus sp. SFB-mouse TaxID=49118 RepID=UPI00022AE604|nr:hypothetical protein [Candidatus Arthromitus sp. SFB-mouse]EGX28644.1 hypothetical protein SFBNYU_006670 [Candidatus Arthromitus sp. SFB-mouse-NYU]
MCKNNRALWYSQSRCRGISLDVVVVGLSEYKNLTKVFPSLVRRTNDLSGFVKDLYKRLRALGFFDGPALAVVLGKKQKEDATPNATI